MKLDPLKTGNLASLLSGLSAESGSLLHSSIQLGLGLTTNTLSYLPAIVFLF
jgi:hypothetical protein